MNKLYRLKKWFTLNDAATKLSLSLGEPITYRNLIELIIERHFDLSWFPGPLKVKSVDKLERESFLAVEGDELVAEWHGPLQYRETDKPLESINMVVTLDLEDPAGPLRDWLRVAWSGS